MGVVRQGQGERKRTVPLSVLLWLSLRLSLSLTPTVAIRLHQGGYTAIMLAAQHGQADCLKVLIASKANIEATKKVRGWVW